MGKFYLQNIHSKPMKRRNYEGGEGEEAQPPAEAEPPKDEEKEPLVDETAVEPDDKAERVRKIEEQMCCCCICRCQGEEDKWYSCCGCFPMKCGLIVIGILTILITLAL